jgi:hypothetical protein
VVVVSGVRRHSDWQLEDVCGTFIFDEATRSGSYDVRALYLSLCDFKVFGCNEE